jgi:hypothetical protein
MKEEIRKYVKQIILFTCKTQLISSIFLLVKCISQRPVLETDHRGIRLLGNVKR